MKQDGFLDKSTNGASKYSKAYHHYGKTQSKTISPFLTTISKTCPYGSQFPVYKVLIAVSKFFMLNEIQVVFLSYLIRETKWDIRDRIISLHAEKVQDIVCSANQSLDYKKIILYLMVSAFTVKYYLNQNTTEEVEQATKRCPNFKRIFQNWAKKHSAIATKINPRMLNTVYKELFSNSRIQNKNYNIVVDSILRISPAYNPEKDKPKKEEKKRAYNHAQSTVKQENVMLKHDKTGYIPTNGFMAKQSEQQNGLFMPFHNEPENLGILRSSLIGLKDEPKMIGYGDVFGEELEEGRSSIVQEESILSFDVIGMSKGVSITDKYISSEAMIKPEDKKQKE